MNDWSMLKKLIWLHIVKGGSAVLKTVTGSLIHITDALALPAEALSVNVEPIQAGSGDPSPDNVRPISGRTSATVTRTGKNLLSLNSDDFDGAGINVTADYLQTGIRVNSLAYANTNARWVIHGLAKMLSGKAVKLSFNVNTSSDNTGGYIVRTQTNGTVVTNYIRSTTAIAGGTSINTSFTVPNDGAEDICFIFYAVGNTTPSSGDTAYTEYTNIQLELGSTATAYEPYRGNTYTIALGDTVYGGTLDVTGGKMVVDRAIVDFGTIAFAKSSATSASGGSVFSIPVSSVGLGMAERVRNAPNTMASDVYKTADSAVWWANQTPDFGMSVNANSFFVADSRYSTAADFNAAVSGVQLVYELATPFEITLTPTQIDMLLGENNLWSDAGDSTLTYYAEGEASTSEALGILLGGTYNNPGGADDVSDDEALGILLGGS